MPEFIRDVFSLSVLGLTPTQKREVLVTLSVGALIAYSVWGFYNFARTSHIAAIRQELATIEQSATAAVSQAKTAAEEGLSAIGQLRAEVLESQMYNRRIIQCRADDPQLRQAYGTQMQSDQSRYHQITNRYLPLPACDEI